MESSPRYARLFGSEPGINPYTRAISDVYQDAFGEGSFIGKSIYDVDAFELSLKNRFPENRILNHDLLEGSYARAALLSDMPLYKECPAQYSADVARRHRWICGDWQIASRVLPRLPRHWCPPSRKSARTLAIEDFGQSQTQPSPCVAGTTVDTGLGPAIAAIVLGPRGHRHPAESRLMHIDSGVIP